MQSEYAADREYTSHVSFVLETGSTLKPLYYLWWPTDAVDAWIDGWIRMVRRSGAATPAGRAHLQRRVYGVRQVDGRLGVSTEARVRARLVHHQVSGVRLSRVPGFAAVHAHLRVRAACARGRPQSVLPSSQARRLSSESAASLPTQREQV